VLKLALALASRRGHAQVTPLHIAFALLAPSCSLQQQQQQPAEEGGSSGSSAGKNQNVMFQLASC
jgi:hypothetical protein